MSMKPREESVDPATTADSAATAKAERERRRKLAEVFGDVLPEGTADDRSDGWGERDGGNEDWLRGEVPPHHG